MSRVSSCIKHPVLAFLQINKREKSLHDEPVLDLAKMLPPATPKIIPQNAIAGVYARQPYRSLGSATFTAECYMMGIGDPSSRTYWKEFKRTRITRKRTHLLLELRKSVQFVPELRHENHGNVHPVLLSSWQTLDATSTISKVKLKLFSRQIL